jgi:hypothetical protein
MEKLKQQLYKMVYDYSIQNKIADTEFVVNVLDLCIEALELNKFVRGYEVDNKKSETYAGYDLGNRYLLFNFGSALNGMYYRLQEEKEIGVISTKFLNYFKINSHIVNGIIFELTTVKQYKDSIEDPTSIESKILYLSLERNLAILNREPIPVTRALYFKMLDGHYKNKMYYNACPSVRMAGIKGAEYERDLSKLVDDDLKGNIEDYMELRLLSDQMDAYREYAPTSFIRTINESTRATVGLPNYAKEIDETEELYKEFAKENNLSYDERVWLGLPISKEEKEKAYQKIINLQNKLLKRD